MLQFKKFAQQNDIVFDEIETIEGDIRLYKTPYGEFPSMTSILGTVLDDSKGLDQWRKRVGKAEAEKITKDASDRGNSLHDLAERYLTNQLSRDQLSGSGKILFNRIKRYLDEIDLVVGVEIPLYSKSKKFAGRTDAICMIKDDLYVIDHKNSRRPITLDKQFSRRKLHKYKTQVAGYAIAFEEMTTIAITKGCLFVGNHLTSNASRFEFDLDVYKEEFMLLLDCYYGYGDVKKSVYYSL